MSPQKYAGAFTIDAEAKEGHTLEEVEKGIDAEIERLKTELVPAEELQKVKNNVAAASFRRLSSNFFILLQLIVYEGYGDWREMNEAPRKAAAVTAEDVQRVAKRYLRKDNRGVYLVTRKGGAAAAPSKVKK
jgi:predicted Zn-dependent peptidase